MKKALFVLAIVLLAVLCSCNPEPPVELCKVFIVNNSGSEIYYASGSHDLKAVADGETEFVTYLKKDSSEEYSFYRVDSYLDIIEKGKPARYPIITEPVVNKTVTADTDKTLSVTYSAGSLVINEI